MTPWPCTSQKRREETPPLTPPRSGEGSKAEDIFAPPSRVGKGAGGLGRLAICNIPCEMLDSNRNKELFNHWQKAYGCRGATQSIE